MFTRSILLVILIGLVSCQSFHSSKESGRRFIANIGPLRFEKFIDDIVLQSKNTTSRVTKAQAEKKALAYIKANHKKMGLTKSQADEITSLYDDIPAMNGIHKHLTRHITDILPINSNIAQKAYKSVIQKPGSINPYSTQGMNLRDSTLAARSSNSPNSPANFDDALVRSEIRSIDDSAVRRLHQDNYKLYKKRLENDPIAAANINEILDSAAAVYKRTGRAGMGKGCKKFTENASPEVLYQKRQVDDVRAALMEERAFEKAGGPFSKIDDVPSSKRLTPDEVDEITEEALAKVLNYTREEAKTAVSRLKRAPCQVY
jgi:hypothetical protein